MPRTLGMPAVLISALLVMSDFESTFFKGIFMVPKELSHSYSKSCNDFQGPQDKESYAHPLKISNSSSLSDEDRETRPPSITFHPVEGSSLNPTHFIPTNNLKESNQARNTMLNIKKVVNPDYGLA